MNIPNLLTISRVILTFMALMLLCIDVKFFSTAAFILFCAACLTDWLDGYVARKFNVVTVFGKFMDALCDKIMVFAMFMTLFALGMYKDWTMPALFCAVAALSRDFFLNGVRMLASSKGIVLAAETVGKYKAFLQMFSIGAIICARMLECDYAGKDSSAYTIFFFVGITCLIISTALALWSGAGYAFRYSNLFKE